MKIMLAATSAFGVDVNNGDVHPREFPREIEEHKREQLLTHGVVVTPSTVYVQAPPPQVFCV